MKESELFALRFPIGEFSPKENITPADIQNCISTIEQFPRRLKHAIEGLTETRLDTPYRPGGWSIRQVVHHTADSHINSFIRFKLALTEDTPTIRPYFEDRWAELPEAKNGPIELSMPFIESLHKRWVVMLKNITPAEMKRSFYHPETKKETPLSEVIQLYAWHCEHHLAHITRLIEKEGWK